MENTKPKKAWWQKKFFFFILLFIFILLSRVIILTKQNNQKYGGVNELAYEDVLKELISNNHPTGILGGTWYMTQSEVKKISSDIRQLDADILVRSTILYGRPVQANYHFVKGRLFQVTVSFDEQFDSLDELSEAFYSTQEKIDRDYGQMSVKLNELIPAVNGINVDQDVLIAEKNLGRTSITHKIMIKDNGIGEILYMYLSSGK